MWQIQLRQVFEMIKQIVAAAMAQYSTVEFGEISGVDPVNQLVQVTMMPNSNPGAPVYSPWLPLSVPLYGVRGMPKVGDQAVVLYSRNAPVAVVGFTYNNVDQTEESAVTGQYRLTQKSGAHEADLLVDGTTGNVVVNKGTAAVARVGDAITVTVGGTPYTGTITSGSPNFKA